MSEGLAVRFCGIFGSLMVNFVKDNLHRKTPIRAEDLNEFTIAAIALLNMGAEQECLNHKDMPAWTRGQLLARLQAVQETDDPVVKECLRYGLPPGVYSELPCGVYVRCFYCGRYVSTVPCLPCMVEGKRWIGRDEPPVDFGKPPPLAKRPTQAPPGSWPKIRVFQARLERDEAIFHPGDSHLWN